MIIATIRTHAEDPIFKKLVRSLDSELAIINGNQNDFFAQFNKVDDIKHAIVVTVNQSPVACGAMKFFDTGTMEVKRMYTSPSFRNQGLASILLLALEDWAKSLGYEKCVLETSTKQPDAIALYFKNNYQRIPNYAPYIGVNESVCFEKTL